ncbi:hypothetical protein [Actinacidiphila glaucinigra]|uniref:GerMN domain-containing protein n=1 Tax=Actinacidiphila glaucinigra TaxID=235986 RepID=A0A239N8C6_9ACTN|nr:hypothetical protein [Actinacidiphila glaucinigra]SNT50439.1 hypothetical protein SAMN05216252_13212 [Actinacidiphila glaucinigra]
MKRTRLAALTTGLAAALTLTACGVPPSGVIEAGEAATGMSSPAPRTANLVLVSLYFLQDGKLTVHARKTTAPASVEDAVRMLFAGPTVAERATVTTELPFLKVGPQVKSNSDSAVYVLLPKDVTPLSQPAMQQLACTVSNADVTLAALSSMAAVGGTGGSSAQPPATKPGSPARTVHAVGDGWSRTQTADSCPEAIRS